MCKIGSVLAIFGPLVRVIVLQTRVRCRAAKTDLPTSSRWRWFFFLNCFYIIAIIAVLASIKLLDKKSISTEIKKPNLCYSWVFKMDYFLTFYLNLMRVARHTSYYVVITFALTFPLVCQPKKILSCKRPLEKTLSSFSRHKKSGNSHLLSIKQLIWFHIQIFNLYFAIRKSEIIGTNRSIWQ